MIHRLFITVVCALMVMINNAFGQLPAGCATGTSFRCDGWPLSRLDLDQQAGGSMLEFVFDDLSDYNSGMTYYGTTILRVTASDTAADGDCAWKLRMIVNNGGAPTPDGEWLQTASYGSSGSIPTIALMEVRVTNACATSPVNGSWQTFALPENGGEIVLIDDGSFVNAAGTGGACGGGQTNSAGSYLTSYGEFAFVVDYRIRPFFNYTPGKYELNIKFCISEDL
jgi:hypothetical protein